MQVKIRVSIRRVSIVSCNRFTVLVPYSSSIEEILSAMLRLGNIYFKGMDDVLSASQYPQSCIWPGIYCLQVGLFLTDQHNSPTRK